MKSFSLYLSKFVTTGSTFIFTILLAKIAGVEYFGIFNLLLMITFILNLVSDWGFPLYGPTELKSMKTDAQRINYLHVITRFRFLLSSLMGLIYLGLILVFYNQHLNLLIWGFLIVFFSFLNIDWVSRSFNAPQVSSIRQVVNAILNIVFVILIYQFKFPLVFVFVTYSLSIFLSYIVGIYLLKQKTGIIFLEPVRIPNLKRKVADIFKKTQFAFIGILLFNLLYALNVPLLSKFSSAYETSIYSSYYAIFSSAASILLITQDIYLPKFTVSEKESFFEKYIKVLFLAAVILIISVLLLPFYFYFLFPATFRINSDLITLFAFLSFTFSLRLLVVNAGLMVGSYRIFYRSNFSALICYLLFVSIFILNDSLNATTSVISLLISEAVAIVFAIVFSQKEFIKVKSGRILFFLAIIIFVIALPSFAPQLYGFVLSGLLLIFGFLFIRVSYMNLKTKVNVAY